MNQTEIIQHIDTLFTPYLSLIGKDIDGYRNHVRRMVLYATTLENLDNIALEKVIIAGVFHDIGIWTTGTVDYIDPSEAEAIKYLQATNKSELQSDVVEMIRYHHKIRSIKNNPLAELFRKADLVDFSWGIIKHGVKRDTIKTTKKLFPNAGFHKKLVALTIGQLKKDPLHPLPMMKF